MSSKSFYFYALMLLQKFTTFLLNIHAEDGKQGNECNYEKDVHSRNSLDISSSYHPSVSNDLRTP